MYYSLPQFESHPDFNKVNPILESFRVELDQIKLDHDNEFFEVMKLTEFTTKLRQMLDQVITTQGDSMPSHYLLKQIMNGYYNSDKKKWGDFCYVYARTFQSIALDTIIADYENKPLQPFEFIPYLKLGKFD